MDDLLILLAILIVIVLFISCIIHCCYRFCKCAFSCCKFKTINDIPEINAILIQGNQEICQLPKIFGQNSKLFAVTNNLDRGTRHIYARHSDDFCSEMDVAKRLKKNLIKSNFLGEEADPQSRGGGRYVWKVKDRYGNSQQLVTILSPRGEDYELITAYKR